MKEVTTRKEDMREVQTDLIAEGWGATRLNHIGTLSISLLSKFYLDDAKKAIEKIVGNRAKVMAVKVGSANLVIVSK